MSPNPCPHISLSLVTTWPRYSIDSVPSVPKPPSPVTIPPPRLTPTAPKLSCPCVSPPCPRCPQVLVSPHEVAAPLRAPRHLLSLQHYFRVFQPRPSCFPFQWVTSSSRSTACYWPAGRRGGCVWPRPRCGGGSAGPRWSWGSFGSATGGTPRWDRGTPRGHRGDTGTPAAPGNAGSPQDGPKAPGTLPVLPSARGTSHAAASQRCPQGSGTPPGGP